jgi:hypothetical protein
MVEEIRRKRLISEQKGENKEDARKNAKEDQFLKETEKRDNDRKAKEEQAEIRQEIGDLKVTVASIADKAKKAEDVRKWFSLFD